MKIDSHRIQPGQQGCSPAAHLSSSPGPGLFQGQFGPPALLQPTQFFVDLLGGTGIRAQVADPLPAGQAKTQFIIHPAIAAPLASDKALPCQDCQLVRGKG